MTVKEKKEIPEAVLELTIYHIARALAKLDYDKEAILNAYPDCPHDDPKTLRKWLAKKENRNIAEVVAEMDPEGSPPDAPPLKTLSADVILTTDWPEPTWAIPNLLPAGLCILAGKPKVGKSWLALQIAQSVASGGMALGECVEKGPVLYLALEDTPSRLQKRMTQQNWPSGLPVDFLCLGDFNQQIGNLLGEGKDQLTRQIYQKRYRLVVVDTVSRAVPSDQADVGQMTLALSPIQEIAQKLNCVVLMIDHHRKGGMNPDPVSDILGSTAKGAMPDCIWGLYRGQGKAGAKLAIIGRDVQERKLILKFDGLTGCWQAEGDADALTITENRQEILDALEALGKAQLKDIVDSVGRNKGNVLKDLHELGKEGYIRKTGEGRGNIYFELLDRER
jgi:hypothetical protein